MSLAFSRCAIASSRVRGSIASRFPRIRCPCGDAGLSFSPARTDSIRERFRRAASEWRETGSLSDEALAARIRDDRIDILVDLALHTAGNRLLTFARKPAPLQITNNQ